MIPNVVKSFFFCNIKSLKIIVFLDNFCDVILVIGLTEIINDIEKGDYLKCLTPTSLSQSNEYLESALSPKSVESQTSCRSHDGVFLRPGEQQKKSLKLVIQFILYYVFIVTFDFR